MKTMIRPSLAAFFERRPALGLPLLDRGFIALYGATARPLAGEAQSLEQPPDARLAISLPSERLDQLANPSQGPKITAVSLRQRASLEGGDQVLLVVRVQQWWPTSSRCPPQATPSAGSYRALPPHHRRATDTKSTPPQLAHRPAAIGHLQDAVLPTPTGSTASTSLIPPRSSPFIAR
jgi:hypothetical protein